LAQHLSEGYNFSRGECHLNEMQEFYNTYGYIPYLRIGERESSWARWLYLNYLPENTIPVTLSLRQLAGDSKRNADTFVWLSFIDKCKDDFPEVVFVFVGLKEEAFDGLRKRSNVVVAKDFGTSIIEDFALIRTSFLYMGVASGVNLVAIFSDLPYLIFQSPNVIKYGLRPGENFTFATNLQKLFGTAIMVTPELLLSEFKKLYSKLNRNQWLRETLGKGRYKHSHPSSVTAINGP
jgi:hypothetical protein